MRVVAAASIALLAVCSLPTLAQQPEQSPAPESEQRAPAQPGQPPQEETAPPVPPPVETPQSASTEGGPALVTFYYRSPIETGKLLGSMMPAEDVFVDGKSLVDLEMDTFATFALEPGVHRFRAKKAEDEFSLELAAGRTYFFRVLAVRSGLSGYSVLTAACPGVGLTESTAARMKPATKIKDRGRHVPGAVPAGSTGAAAEGEEALVVFYRPWRQGGELLNTSVFVDGVEIADLDNECYLPVRVPPGEHAFRSDEEGDAFSLDLAPGSVSYVRIDLVHGVWKGHGRLLLVDPIQGRAESRTSAMRLAKDIRVPAMVVRDPLPEEPVPTFEPGGGKATVRVYFPRPEQGPHNAGFIAHDVTVKVDDVNVAELDDRTYVDLLLEPGMHRFAIDKYKSVFELPVEAAARLYFRVELDGSFHPVCAEQGLSETGTKRMQRTAKILAPALVAPR